MVLPHLATTYVAGPHIGDDVTIRHVSFFLFHGLSSCCYLTTNFDSKVHLINVIIANLSSSLQHKNKDIILYLMRYFDARNTMPIICAKLQSTCFPYNTKYGSCQIHFDLPIIFVIYSYLFPCCTAIWLTFFLFMTKSLVGLGFGRKRRKMNNITGQQEKPYANFVNNDKPLK